MHCGTYGRLGRSSQPTGEPPQELPSRLGALVAEKGWGYNRLPGGPVTSSPPTSLVLEVIIGFVSDKAVIIIVALQLHDRPSAYDHEL